MTPGKVISNRGTVSVQMTAHDIISLAVNVVQNGRSLDDVGYGSAEDPLTLRQMLAEVYDHVLTTNSQAGSRLPHKRRRREPEVLRINGQKSGRWTVAAPSEASEHDSKGGGP
jgi:hypothetical protein